MPHWNWNSVVIHAPIEAVKRRLFISNSKHNMYWFNMHLLFPTTFYKKHDKSWSSLWDYGWACKATGSEWFPQDITLSECGNITQLYYDTARVPNIGTLRRLSEATGWKIENEFKECWVGFEWTFIVEGGVIQVYELWDCLPSCRGA